MGSTPKMEYQVYICIFQKNSAMATLGLKELGVFLWEGREIVLPRWLSQFSKIPSQRNFPKSFKPKVARGKFIGKMQKKSGIMKSGLDVMPLFLLDNLVRRCA